jgi:hypothetical protein
MKPFRFLFNPPPRSELRAEEVMLGAAQKSQYLQDGRILRQLCAYFPSETVKQWDISRKIYPFFCANFGMEGVFQDDEEIRATDGIQG